MKLFFKLLRAVIGPFMLLGETLGRPKGLTRTPAAQAEVDRECRDLVLYQYKTCPFCIKVRQEMRRLSLNIEKRDAQHPCIDRQDLITGGGQAKVPCLKITDPTGNSQWMYESAEIIAYLRQRFSRA
jgi:glutaredoxin